MPVLDTGVGYRGWVRTTALAIPVISCALDKIPVPIVGDDLIHGSSSDNTASAIHWAQGKNRYEGDLNTHLFGNFWATLQTWVMSDRVTGIGIEYSPNGAVGNKYAYTDAKVKTCTLSASAEGNTPVGMTLALRATGRTASVNDGIIGTPTDRATTLNAAPIPWWNTCVSYSAPTNWGTNIATAAKVVSWSLTIENNSFEVHTLDCDSPEVARDPSWVMQGLLAASGNVVLYSPTGVIIPDEGYAITFTFKGFGGAEVGTIVLPQVLWEGYPMGISGANVKVVRTLNFRGLGDLTNAACYST